MSIDKDLLDRLMEGRSPGDLFGKTGILAELTKALAERALSTEMDVHLHEERAEQAPEGQNQPANRRNGSSQRDRKLETRQRPEAPHVGPDSDESTHRDERLRLRDGNERAGQGRSAQHPDGQFGIGFSGDGPGALKIEARGDALSCIDLAEPWAFTGNETVFYR